MYFQKKSFTNHVCSLKKLALSREVGRYGIYVFKLFNSAFCSSFLNQNPSPIFHYAWKWRFSNAIWKNNAAKNLLTFMETIFLFKCNYFTECDHKSKSLEFSFWRTHSNFHDFLSGIKAQPLQPDDRSLLFSPKKVSNKI